eukprot:19963-Heterococcus_DN1.PRE.1
MPLAKGGGRYSSCMHLSQGIRVLSIPARCEASGGFAAVIAHVTTPLTCSNASHRHLGAAKPRDAAATSELQQ